MKEFVGENLSYVKSKTETVLINSNFKCGYFIDRERLFDIINQNTTLIVRMTLVRIQGFSVSFIVTTLAKQTGKKPANNKFTRSPL